MMGLTKDPPIQWSNLRGALHNPSFFDARDASFTALDDRHAEGELTDDEFRACRLAMWTAFAGFGMGAWVQHVGNSYTDAQSDSHLPDDLGGTEVIRPTGTGQGRDVAQMAGTADPHLQRLIRQLITAWPRLDEHARGRVLGQVETLAVAGAPGPQT